MVIVNPIELYDQQ
jgi:hypothetical protein